MSKQCTLCNKQFHTTAQFDKHTAYCKWLHTSNAKKTQEQEAVEKMNEVQKTRLLVDLLHKQQIMFAKMDKMQKEIQSLKTRQRINMSKWLTKTKTPTKSFFQWIQTIPVTQDHLEKVFQQDLLQGVIEAIKEEIRSYKYQNKLIPMYAFTQKNKTIYVYDCAHKTPPPINKKDEMAWQLITTDHIKKIFNLLGKKFEDQFSQWQDRHERLLEQSDEWKEKEMMYTRKIMGIMDNEIARNSRLKQWMYTQIHLPFQETVLDMET